MTFFLKMHGLGNDFVVFDGRKTPLEIDASLARAIADRRSGIGCDQIIVMESSKNASQTVMRIMNADGGEVESCGNAARCVARLLMNETGTQDVQIDTLGGPLSCSDAGHGEVTVDIGPPRLDWNEIPLSKAVDTNGFAIEANGVSVLASAVSVGNPHLVLFVDDVSAVDVARTGSTLEHHPLFPERTNVEFVQILSPTRMRMRVWERGVGITRACGTGACAVLVAAARRKLSSRKAEIVLDGGTLLIEWRERDGHVLMTGPSSFSFSGDVDLALLEPVK